MYESRRAPILSPGEFRVRIARHGLAALGVIAGALLVGVVGYHLLGGLSWIDSLLNASMILGGMGPVDPLNSDSAKLFASFYALFSGLVFVGLLGIILAPFAHRLLHHFHWEEEDEDPEAKVVRNSV